MAHINPVKINGYYYAYAPCPFANCYTITISQITQCWFGADRKDEFEIMPTASFTTSSGFYLRTQNDEFSDAWIEAVFILN